MRHCKVCPDFLRYLKHWRFSLSGDCQLLWKYILHLHWSIWVNGLLKGINTEVFKYFILLNCLSPIREVFKHNSCVFHIIKRTAVKRLSSLRTWWLPTAQLSKHSPCSSDWRFCTNFNPHCDIVHHKWLSLTNTDSNFLFVLPQCLHSQYVILSYT